jgi:enoyl-CoA hydratase
MTYTRLNVSVSDRIGHIELSVPDELNRMPPAFWTEFPAALEELDRRGDVRALIISSTGRHFTAGMDVSAFTGDRQASWIEAARAKRRVATLTGSSASSRGWKRCACRCSQRCRVVALAVVWT